MPEANLRDPAELQLCDLPRSCPRKTSKFPRRNHFGCYLWNSKELSDGSTFLRSGPVQERVPRYIRTSGLLGFYGSSVLHLQYDENSRSQRRDHHQGDPKKARECDDGNAAFAEAVLHAQEYQEIKKSIDLSEMLATKKDVTKPNPEFKASEDTKKTSLKDDDPSKVTQIGVSLGSA